MLAECSEVSSARIGVATEHFRSYARHCGTGDTKHADTGGTGRAGDGGDGVGGGHSVNYAGCVCLGGICGLHAVILSAVYRDLRVRSFVRTGFYRDRPSFREHPPLTPALSPKGRARSWKPG